MVGIPGNLEGKGIGGKTVKKWTDKDSRLENPRSGQRLVVARGQQRKDHPHWIA